MQSPTSVRQRKIIRIHHAASGPLRLDYVVLPVGYSYNRDVAGAKHGDTLRLFDAGDHEIVCVRRLKIDKPETDLLCRIRYGITARACLSRWKINAQMEGHGAKAVSTEECLWVIFKTNELDSE